MKKNQMETKQNQSAIASVPSDSLGFQHTPTFPGHFGWYHWTAWRSYCPCTPSFVQRQAGANSHVLKQSCKTCHQMSPQLLLPAPNPSALSYLAVATTDSQHFSSLPRRWGKRKPCAILIWHSSKASTLPSTLKIRRFYGEILLQQLGIGSRVLDMPTAAVFL